MANETPSGYNLRSAARVVRSAVSRGAEVVNETIISPLLSAASYATGNSPQPTAATAADNQHAPAGELADQTDRAQNTPDSRVQHGSQAGAEELLPRSPTSPLGSARNSQAPTQPSSLSTPVLNSRGQQPRSGNNNQGQQHSEIQPADVVVPTAGNTDMQLAIQEAVKAEMQAYMRRTKRDEEGQERADSINRYGQATGVFKNAPENIRVNPVYSRQVQPGGTGETNPPPASVPSRQYRQPPEDTFRREEPRPLSNLNPQKGTENALQPLVEPGPIMLRVPMPDRFDPARHSWHTWKRSLLFFLRSMKLPYILEPEGAHEYTVDVHSNVIALLIQVLPESDKAWIVARDDTAAPDSVYTVWKYLEMRYGAHNEHRLHSKLSEYDMLVHKSNESTTDYVIRVKRLTEELYTLGHKVDPLTHKLKLLKVKPTAGTTQDVHDVFISTIRTQLKDLFVEDIEQKLITHEHSLREQQSTSGRNHVVGYAASSSWRAKSSASNTPGPLSSQLLQAINAYKDTNPWIPIKRNSGECFIHKQLGESKVHLPRDCRLAAHPAAKAVVTRILKRRDDFRSSRSGAKPNPQGQARSLVKEGESTSK